MKTKIDGDSPNTSLEAGKEALDERGAVVEEDGYVGSFLNPQSAKRIGQAIDSLVGLPVGPFGIAVSDG